MTILITGGAGTLASDFVDYWVEHRIQEELILLDILPEEEADISRLNNPRLKYVRGSADDEIILRKIFQSHKVSSVLHFASSMDSGISGFNSNVLTILMVMKVASANGSPQIFYPQSFLTRSTEQPVTDESLFTQQHSEYSLFKMLCEIYLKEYKGKYSVGIIGTTISPKLTIGPIPAFVTRVQNNNPVSISDTARDYLNPEDVVSAILLIIRNSFTAKTFCIGSGKSTHTKEIYYMVADLLNKKIQKVDIIIEPNIGDPKNVVILPSKVLIAHGWTLHKDIEKSLNKCVETFRKNNQKIRHHHR
jgi:nucleoside-diphosphate-sugar epimerase